MGVEQRALPKHDNTVIRRSGSQKAKRLVMARVNQIGCCALTRNRANMHPQNGNAQTCLLEQETVHSRYAGYKKSHDPPSEHERTTGHKHRDRFSLFTLLISHGSFTITLLGLSSRQPALTLRYLHLCLVHTSRPPFDFT